MPFFSPILKVFTLMSGPPHPSLLWDLPESALTNECLPDDQNNAMFIPETSKISAEAARHLLSDLSDACFVEGLCLNEELFPDQEIVQRDRQPFTDETQRKFREVDLWLEDQNNLPPTLTPDFEKPCDGGDIPLHLLEQMGLLNSCRSQPKPTHLDCRHNANPNVKVNPAMCGIVENIPDNANGPSTSEREKSGSSLSQLFQDEELNEEDMKEIGLSMKTINKNIEHKAYLLDVNHQTVSSNSSDQHGLIDAPPNVANNLSTVQGISNQALAQTSPLKFDPSRRLLEILPLSDTSPKMLKTPAKSASPNNSELALLRLKAGPKMMEMPPSLVQSPRVYEIHQFPLMKSSSATAQTPEMLSRLESPKSKTVEFSPSSKRDLQSVDTPTVKALTNPKDAALMPKLEIIMHSPGSMMQSTINKNITSNPHEESSSRCTLASSTGQVPTTLTQQSMQEHSSLSQLFQTQEFTVDQYVDTIRSILPDAMTQQQTEVASVENPPDHEQPVKTNSQPFIIKGNEPKLFDMTVKREEDRPWKRQVAEKVIDPSAQVSKRDQKCPEDIPMVVSPYFPNNANHPVQTDKRTSPVSSQVLPEYSSEDVLGKLLNYEKAADDHQICKDFFSQRSPQQSPAPYSSQRKRIRKDEGMPKSKKTRLMKKADCPKITDYFSTVKTVGRTKTKTEVSSPRRADQLERSAGAFHFEDLPSGSQTKMSDFYVPRPHSQQPIPSQSSQAIHVGAMSPEPVDTVQIGTIIEYNCFPPDRRRFPGEDCEVIVLEEEKVEEVAASMENSGDLLEIGFTICYRQKYSRLNMPDDGGTLHCPSGIMSSVQFANYNTLVIYQDINALARENSRSFLLCLLESKCRKVCFEAQAFIMFVLDVLREQELRICYDWHLYDPMIGVWLMDPDHPPRNFPCLLKEFGLKVAKSDRDDWRLTVSKYLSLQSLLIEKLYNKLTELDLWNVFCHMETPITSILAAMELRNIEVDYSRLKETSEVLQKKMSAIEQDAWKLVGKKFQLSSPVQLRRILYDELKLDEIGSVSVKSTATAKAKSTDEATLKSLAGLHPLPGLILEFRHAQKISSTYINGLLSHVVDKRKISTTWEQCAAATGRLTSSNPNMQSIPKREEDMTIAGESFNVRKVFTARPGRKFIAVDFQQIELRAFAHLSKDDQLMSVFKQPGDIFAAMTKLRLGSDDFDATEREKTKTLMYALLYGAGAHRISEVLSIDAVSATRICADFYGLFPSLKNFRASVLNECRARNELRSLSGRRRLFPDVSASCIQKRRYAERQAVNFTIQGSVADICKASMLRTEMALRERNLDATLLLQIHDELFWEVPEHIETQVKDTIRTSIEETSDHWTKKFNLDVPLPVKITTGSKWGDMK